MVKKIIFLIVILWGCSANNLSVKTEIINIKGSDTMRKMVSALAEKYTDENPQVIIRVFGGGTSTGIDELIKGEIDICTSSRELTALESKKLSEYYGSIGYYYLIAKDALCIFINKNSPVEDLTVEQVKKIFTGEIKNFKDLGLEDVPIQLAIRDNNSGTKAYLKRNVLEGNEFSSKAKIFSTTEEIAEYVSQHKYSIGFGGIGWLNNIQAAKINGVKANNLSVKQDLYPFTRYLHFFTTKYQNGELKKFIDWVLSPEGQSIIKEEGFIPLWEIDY